MIDIGTLVCTALCEVSLLVGYTLALWEQTISGARLFVMDFLEAIR